MVRAHPADVRSIVMLLRISNAGSHSKMLKIAAVGKPYHMEICLMDSLRWNERGTGAHQVL